MLDPNNETFNIEKYRKQLVSSDWEKKSNDIDFYLGEQVDSPLDADYGTNHLKVKTFIIPGTDTFETWRFIGPVSKDDLEADLVRDSEGNLVGAETAKSYFAIRKDKVGRDAKAKVDHMGNQIAWELLGLGYTVYFKVMTAEADIEDPEFWEPLKNKTTYRIRYLTSGGNYSATVAQNMVDVAEFCNRGEDKPTVEDADTYNADIPTGRGDCIALLDIDESTGAIQTATTQGAILQAFGEAAKLLPSSKYAAIFAPKVYYNLDYGENGIYPTNIPFPCSFHYLACAAKAQQRFAEWYAVAGYTRGVSTYSITHTSKDFGDISINTLAPRVSNNYTDRAINLVLNERGSYYLWGNRTSELLDKKGLRFSHFLNIRQLCCTIKQILFDATRQFTFDPNSDRLWVNFVNAIRPTLEKMQGDQGIKAYKISKVATDKKALLIAKIRIIPIEALEDFDISIYLEDSLSGMEIGFDETEAE